MQYHMTAKNLTAGYNGNPVFRNFEIKIPSGKITTLIGANGSGKSTVLKTLARLLTPLEGVVYLDGESIHRMPTKSVAQKLAMLPQGGTDARRDHRTGSGRVWPVSLSRKAVWVDRERR